MIATPINEMIIATFVQVPIVSPIRQKPQIAAQKGVVAPIVYW